MTSAVYPGSFDPITYGHLDVIERACHVFDRVIVAILVNTTKAPRRPAEDRAATVRASLAEALGDRAAGIGVETFEGLTVEFARRSGAAFIVRGLRAVSDFESEMQMAHTNRKLVPEVDTVFFMTALEHAYVSSTLVKEIALLGGDVSGMVPPAVVRELASGAGRRPADARPTPGRTAESVG